MSVRSTASVLWFVLLSLVPVVKADVIPFTGTASFGGDVEDFLLSGPSLSLSSGAPRGARYSDSLL